MPFERIECETHSKQAGDGRRHDPINYMGLGCFDCLFDQAKEHRSHVDDIVQATMARREKVASNE